MKFFFFLSGLFVCFQMDSMNNMGALAMGTPAAVSAAFPQSLATLSTAAVAAAPGSPPKGFPEINQAQPGYSSIQALTSQLQSKSC